MIVIARVTVVNSSVERRLDDESLDAYVIKIWFINDILRCDAYRCRGAPGATF